MNKKIMAVFLSLVASSAFASVKDDMKVSAKLEKYCSVSMVNVNFGELTGTNTVNENLKVHCTKNTPLVITGYSANNPEGYKGGFLTQNGKQVTQLGNVNRIPGEGIRYHAWTDNIKTNDDFSLVYKGDTLGKDFNPSGGTSPILDYRLLITTKTSNAFNIPLVFKIHPDYNEQKYLFPAGVYNDTFSINLDY